MCCELHANRFTATVTSRVLTDDVRLDHRLHAQASWGRTLPLTLAYRVTWAPVRTPSPVEAPTPVEAEPALV